jgi:hypothetical protein
MKNQQIKILKRCAAAVCLLLIVFSCENPFDVPVADRDSGHISIAFEVEMMVSKTAARLSEVLTDDFVVEIYRADGSVYQTFSRLADIPAAIPLEPGNYFVAIHSPNENIVAFDNPYYAGESAIFSLNSGEEKVIPVTAVMANCMLTVVYQASITENYSAYSTAVTNASGSLTFGMTETRAGYFPLDPILIEATLTYLNADGTEATKTLTGSIPAPVAQTHYQVSLEAGSLQGTGSLTVFVDETLFTEIIHISEETLIPVEGPVPYGDLLISEIMYNPSAVSDTEGEWFEIYNDGTQAYDLFQLVIKKGNEVQHIINEHLLINPGQFLVLARHLNATTTAGYIYGSALSLTNTADEIILANYGDDGTNGSEICSVSYGTAGFPDATGASLNLDPAAFDVELAKNGNNWCLPVSTFDTGDLGTPGIMNDVCSF